MAHTAVVTLNAATLNAGSVGYGDVTITSDTDPIHVTGITLFPSDARFPVSFNLQLIQGCGGAGPDPDAPQNTLGTGQSGPSPMSTCNIDGGGTRVYPFSYCANGPQGVGRQQTVDIDCQAELSDGTILNGTPATLTVNSVPSSAPDGQPA